jgi:hypothetical protein
VITATGDGAHTILVPENELKIQLHKMFCCCKQDWDKCESEGITAIVQSLDDEDAWTHEYPNYQRHIWSDHGEDYTVTVARLLESPARAVLAEAERALRERADSEQVADEFEAGYQTGIEDAADMLRDLGKA